MSPIVSDVVDGASGFVMAVCCARVCGREAGFSLAQRTMKLCAASVEMTTSGVDQDSNDSFFG
jgi:hypothetical protein